MTTNSRKFFTSVAAAHRYLKVAGFTLIDIGHPFGWANFDRKRAASVRWNAAGYFITYIAI